VVVAPEAFDLWLDCATVDADTAAALIAPAPETLFEAYEVSTAVNRTADDRPALIAPLAAAGAAPAEAEKPPTPPARAAKPKRRDDQGSLF
jgi:hypothetical protein